MATDATWMKEAEALLKDYFMSCPCKQTPCCALCERLVNLLNK